MSNWKTLPYDVARCHGTLLVAGRTELCESREKCLRYLQRKHTGLRTPFSFNESATKEKCDAMISQ